MSFKDNVFFVVKNIPKGRTLTYKQVAAAAGNPKACRAVGSILHTNFDPEIPCHRVVCFDGKTGSYNRGPELKKKLLEQEADFSG